MSTAEITKTAPNSTRCLVEVAEGGRVGAIFPRKRRTCRIFVQNAVKTEVLTGENALQQNCNKTVTQQIVVVQKPQPNVSETAKRPKIVQQIIEKEVAN